MDRLSEPMHEGVVLLDAGIVHDVAVALSGDWQPDQEPDERRRAELVAAARLRMFADRDQYGLALAATPKARADGLGYPEAAWSVGFVQDVARIAGSPPPADVSALEAILKQEGIDAASATCLAYAVLFDAVTYVITGSPDALMHQRADDRPARLEIIDPVDAVERLGLVPGEVPLVGPPSGTRLAAGPHFWLV